MRVIGGLYKGRVLYGFDGKDIRPTSDMTRESLFNILQTRIVGADFLELFCGSGAVGIEALSRGANSVTFNDKDSYSLALTQKNLEKVKAENFIVHRGDGVACLADCGKTYDIIFIDPPYSSTLGVQALELASSALNDDGIVVFENEKSFSGKPKGLVLYDERKYGRAYLSFFKREE